MPVFLPIITVLGLASGALAWLYFGLPGLLTLTYGITDFCQSIFVRCVESFSLIKIAFLWAGIFTLASGGIYGIIKAATGILKAHGAIKRLPLFDNGGTVVLIRDDKSKAAFTHGLLNPRIYISTGLIKSLDKKELRVVFLHELHHKRHFDPLMFFLLTLLKDTFFYLPLVKDFIRILKIKRELLADDSAISKNSEGLSLAAALVKVASFNNVLYVPASFTGSEGGIIISRVKRIIEGSEIRFAPPSFKATALSLAAAAFLTVSLAMPLAAAPKAEECTTEHCAVHIDKLGASCKAHCKTHTGSHLHKH